MGGEHFDKVATVYARGRPPYPERVWTLLTEHGVLRPGALLLEIGAGSGQATAALVAGGARVDAVEPGPRLAADLRRRLPNVQVAEGRIEDQDLPGSRYDAAVAATSLHWVDLAVVLPRVHHALRPGGLLAAWWTVFGDPAVRTPFRDAVQRIANPTGAPETRRTALDTDAWEADLTAGGWFAPVVTEVVRWRVTLTTEQVRDLFTTFPTWTPAQVDAIAAAAERLGGRVEEHYATAVYVLRRLDL
ncbi:MAG: class I SAM-dependent methyltransferase [Nocardioides sp.]